MFVCPGRWMFPAGLRVGKKKRRLPEESRRLYGIIVEGGQGVGIPVTTTSSM